MSQRAIAKRAGCALATVSRAFANDPAVLPATRLRVFAAAAELGYMPQKVRDPVPNQRYRTLAVLTGESAGDSALGSIHADLLAGIAEAALSNSLTVQICYLSVSDTEALRLGVLPAALHEVPLRGAVLYGIKDVVAIRALADQLPCAMIGSMFHLCEPWISVNINQYAGILQMLDHLIAFGHKRIGFLRSKSAGDRGSERMGAFIAGLSLRELPLKMADIVPVAHSADWRRAERATRAGVTAWIADSQKSGEGLVAALTAADLPVPQRVSVASFRAHAINNGLQLTGIYGPWRAIGRAAVMALANPLPTAEPGRRILLDAGLDVGRTTAQRSS